MRTKEQKVRSREAARRFRERHPDSARAASRRWRERNPDKVRENNRRPRKRLYDSIKRKAWREKRLADPGYRDRINRQTNERATAIRRWLDDRKVSLGCVDCGFHSHPAALHFDHVKGEKTLNVCNSKSIAQAELEIAKCVVRCANCHAIKTWKNHLPAHKLPEKSSL